MRCDVCSQEFANSEELKRHMEQAHAEDEGEKPDLMDRPGQGEMPEPAERRTR